jgi:hypothetical protein
MSIGACSAPAVAPSTCGRARPPLLRALGAADPPLEIEVGGQRFHRCDIYKHDSWAATALYVGRDRRRIICKLNRQQPILGLPMKWLGRRLAAREARFLALMADHPLVPDGCGPVLIDSRPAPHAVAHEFVPGRPLGRSDSLPAEFVPELERLLEVLHARGAAYVDLHKRENILVGDDGRPRLIDFQISVWLPRVWPLTLLLHIFQECDRYHLSKHARRLQMGASAAAEVRRRRERPIWIGLHRSVAVPFRKARRRLLVWLGVRTGDGKARSEAAPEFGILHH